MPNETLMQRNARYLELVLRPIRVCASYKPKMGHGAGIGMNLADFQSLYGADPFYSWFGLEHPLMYAAHKAAGGMTSIYRQIGTGCEHLVQAILQDELGLSVADSQWGYNIQGANKKTRTLSLDGRIPLDKVVDQGKRQRVQEWIQQACEQLHVAPAIAHSLSGAVFEVRQGYKSKDSKRQNADISNAATAYTQAYMPCVIVLSTQIDSDIVTRYRNEQWLILTGHVAHATPLDSTYSFFKEVVGYDLAGFFSEHTEILRLEMDKILTSLLQAS